MAAGINAAVNIALPHRWFPEFAKDKIPPAADSYSTHQVIAICQGSPPEYKKSDKRLKSYSFIRITFNAFSLAAF